MGTSNLWTIESDGATAVLCTPRFQARVDLGRPSAGVRILSVGGAPVDDSKSILGLDLEPEGSGTGVLRPDEWFVRGNDLIASYPTTQRQTRMQVYWRALVDPATDGDCGLDVIASVQTDRLASDPRVRSRSQFAASRWGVLTGGRRDLQWFDTKSLGDFPRELRPAPRATVAQWSPERSWYVEMPFPGDACSTRIELVASLTDGGTYQGGVEQNLFDPFLEKGVIRRSRLRGLLLPFDADDASVVAAADRFERTALPLTA